MEDRALVGGEWTPALLDHWTIGGRKKSRMGGIAQRCSRSTSAASASGARGHPPGLHPARNGQSLRQSRGDIAEARVAFRVDTARTRVRLAQPPPDLTVSMAKDELL
jgi:hypothetical protein